MSWTGGVAALLVSFLATALLGIVVIPALRRLKFGQTIKEIGPTWHQKKNGTPTMGGLLFAAGITLGVVAGFVVFYVASGSTSQAIGFSENVRLWSGLLAAFAFGFIGFIDDYIKVVKKRNLGLTALQKTIMQLVIAVAYLVSLSLGGGLSTILDFPFIGQVDFGWFFYPLCVIGIYFIVNAVNLTDGIDGLAASVTAVYAIVFMLLASVLDLFSVHLFAAAVVGGCLGFLVWNFYPARVFMGDTGSMFLGGAVVALGFGIGQPLLILLAGLVYVIEALSVVIQVISFKTTGKRVFKMSPIHHHFEMCGWGELKIVLVFTLFAVLFGVLSILCLIYGIL